MFKRYWISFTKFNKREKFFRFEFVLLKLLREIKNCFHLASNRSMNILHLILFQFILLLVFKILHQFFIYSRGIWMFLTSFCYVTNRIFYWNRFQLTIWMRNVWAHIIIITHYKYEQGSVEPLGILKFLVTKHIIRKAYYYLNS